MVRLPAYSGGWIILTLEVLITSAKIFVRFAGQHPVIPAEAGIQSFQFLDPDFRRGDGQTFALVGRPNFLSAKRT